MFDSMLYKQVDGLAMGSPIAPALANIVLNSLQIKFLQEYPPGFQPLTYRRYLDHTFVVYSGEEKHHFILTISIAASHDSIHNGNKNEEQLLFVDVIVHKGLLDFYG